GGTVAADQDEGVEAVGVVQAQQKRDAGADAAAAADRARDAEILHHPDDVVAHVLERVTGGHFCGAAIAADIDAHDPEPGGKMRGLVHPKVVVERVGVNEDERRSIAGDLVPDVDTVGPAEWHDGLRLPPMLYRRARTSIVSGPTIS